MKDAIAFMKWQRLVPWKIIALMERPHQPLAPPGFGASKPAFYELLEPGSRIWIVTRISKVFSLAGCVVVQTVLDRDKIPKDKWPVEVRDLLTQWQYVAVADRSDSRFFETNNAAPILDKHKVSFAQYRNIVYHEGPLQDSFNSCIEQSRKTVFLSYRWNKGKRFAAALAKEFRNRGMAPWLDALAVPGYRADREKDGKAPRLRKLIKRGIEKSQFAVAINTEGFGRKTWTSMEFDHIRKKNITWYQVMRGGLEHACDEAPIDGRNPAEIVTEILQRRAPVA